MKFLVGLLIAVLITYGMIVPRVEAAASGFHVGAITLDGPGIIAAIISIAGIAYAIGQTNGK